MAQLVEDIATTLAADWGLNEFPDEWVKATVDGNFSEFEALSEAVQPYVLDSNEICERLNQLTTLFAEYEARADSAEIWTSLAEADVKPLNLVVLLFYAIERGLRKDATFELQKVAVLASRAYLAVSAISGSQAYGIFNNLLYLRVTECARLAVRQLACERANTSTTKKKSKGRESKKSNSKSSRSTTTLNDMSSLGTENESLSANQQDELEEALYDYLDSMFVFLGKVGLSGCPEAVIATANALRDLLKLDAQKCDSAQVVERLGDFSMIRNKSSRALALMHRLMDRRHDGRGGETVLARCIMPRLLLWDFGGTLTPPNASIPALFAHLKDLAIQFIDQRIQLNSKEELQTLFKVLQNICVKCPDRTEYRSKVAQIVAQLVLSLPNELVQEFVDFLSVFAQNMKTAYRVFAVDLAPQLVCQFATKTNEQNEPLFENMRLTLLTMVLKRCNDKAPTVRTRALTNLATIMSAPDAAYNAILARISKELSLEEDDPNGEDGDGRENPDHPPNGDNDALMSLIAARCDDDKVYARKAAVLALEALYSALNPENRLKALKMLKTRTLDISVMVRKQGADSLTHLLTKLPSESVRKTWLEAVLPLVTDRESSVQLFACKLVNESFIAKIHAGDDADVWPLLALIEQQQDLRRYLLRALIHLAKENQLSHKIVAVLEDKSRDPDKSNAAWMLLSELSGVFKVSPKQARVRWYALNDSADRMLGYMAKVLAAAASRMTDTDRADLLQDVTDKLLSFRVDVKNLGAVFNAANCLFDAVGEEAPGRKDMERWCRRFVESCETRLSSVIFTPNQDATKDVTCEEELVRVLVALGEAVQYCPSLITKRIFTIVQAFVCNDTVQTEMSRHHTQHTQHTNDHGETTDRQSQGMSQGQSQGLSQGQSQGQPGVPLVTKAVRAHAVATLGKLCLQDEDGAKRCVPALVRELQTNPDHIIRNNIIVVLSDLCIRFTLLVDRYTGTIAACLKDRSTLVRRQTLTLLTNLIKEGFLKWQGELMYRFVSTLLDECEQVREFAEFCLVHVLLRQFPGMFFHHFIECLFFFNAVKHPSWSAASEAAALAMGEAVATSNESQQFSLKGDHHYEERMRLYRFMVKQFSDQEKFSIAARISHDVFGAVSEGSIVFEADGVRNLVRDALKVMVCSEIKLSMAIGQKDGGDDDEPMEAAPQVVQDVAKKAITAVFRRAVMDQILPSVIALRTFMQRPENRGPLFRDVMILIKDLSKDHREDLDNFLASDALLKAEIEFDLKKHDQREKRREEKRLAQLQKEQEGEQEQNKTAIPPTPRRQSLAAADLVTATDNEEGAPNAVPEPQEVAPMDEANNQKESEAATSSKDNDESLEEDQAEIVAEAAAPALPAIVLEQEADKETENQPATAVEHDQEMTTADAEIEEPIDTNGSPVQKKSRGLPPRAISTPQNSQLTDVTFALGNEFNFTLAASPILRRPSKRSTRASKAPAVQSIQEDE